ncbi:MAG: phosphatase PAP2 family protein [Methylomonas lenta]|nr:phosphatase PAP2 family protein [Methylomonas lenta]
MAEQINKRARVEFLSLLILMISSTAVFWLTDLDFEIAAWFYQPDKSGQVWPYQNWLPFKLLYDYVFASCLAVGLAALTVYIAGYFYDFCRRLQRQALYILLIILIGPLLMVNFVFKDHWGRPRPVHIQQFGGEYAYAPPLKLAHTPDKSFVCGHCSVAYLFFVFYFLSQKHKRFYFLLTISLASFMGFSRMSAGGHFMSDVLWSGYLMFFVGYALYYGWFLSAKPDHAKPENPS